MAVKKPRGKQSSSRNVSRSRSASRSRNVSKKRAVSRSSRRVTAPIEMKSLISDPKLERGRSASDSSDESVKKIKPGRISRVPSTGRMGTRSSIRIIERLESSLVSDKLEPTPSERPRQPSGLVRGVMCKLNGFAKKVGMCICSEGIDCFVSFIVVPLFVYWCVFLSVSPTQENTFAHVFSPFGKARVFCGAALPYDLNSLNPLVVAGVPTFCIINFLLNRLIPFGRRSIVVGGCRAEHKANGLLVFLLIGLTLVGYNIKGHEYLGHISMAHFTSHLPSILIGSWLTAFAMSLHAYWHSRHARVSHGVNKFVDFYNGREIKYRVYSLDLKILVCYPAVIGCCVLQGALTLRQYLDHSKVSPGLLTSVVLGFITALDFFVFEPTTLYSNEMLHSGCGMRRAQRYLLVEPFMRSLTAMFLTFNFSAGFPSDSSKSCDGILMGFAVAVFILGLWVYRRATNQQFLFRCDPYHPSFENLPVIPSKSGKRILAGGWWGRLRNPDDLGKVLMLIGMTIPAGFSSFVPWILPIVFVVSNVLRNPLSDRVCAEEFGATAWGKYVKAVPYRMIPRVY